MSENAENETAWFSPEVAGVVQEIVKMNLKNHQKLSEKLEVLSKSPLLLFPHPSTVNDELEGNELEKDKDFPAKLELPDDVTEEIVERVLVQCCASTLGNPHKTIDLMTSPRLINWGIIRRPDKKLAVQFLLWKVSTRTPRSAKRRVGQRVLKIKQNANLTATFNETMDTDNPNTYRAANYSFNFD